MNEFAIFIIKQTNIDNYIYHQ
jgi:hypothetical protein